MYMSIAALVTSIPFVMPTPAADVLKPLEQLQAEEFVPMPKHRVTDIIKFRFELLETLNMAKVMPTPKMAMLLIKGYFNEPKTQEQFGVVKYEMDVNVANDDNWALYVQPVYEGFRFEAFNILHFDAFEVRKVVYGNEVRDRFIKSGDISVGR